MRIDVRDADARRLGRIEVDPEERPNLVRIAEGEANGQASEGATHERFVNWDGALDDAGQLRRCVMCGCPSMYRSKILPQVTPFIAVLAFAGAIVGLLGDPANPVLLPALVVLLVVDIATLALAGTRLTCYRCGSVYSRLPIARYHRRWDPSEAERAREARATTTGPSPVAGPPRS